MQISWIAFAVLAGAVLPIQAVVNAGLARQGATPVWAGVISATVTAVALALLAAGPLRIPMPKLAPLMQAPAWLWTGGLFGCVVLIAMMTAAPRIGAAAMIASVIAGQMLCSLLLDHFGWFGVPQEAISPGRLAGAVAICAGAALIRLC